MKLASLLNNFLLCCIYHWLSKCRQWSKNRSERRQFCMLLGQIRSGRRKFGRRSFPISVEANGEWFHRSPQCYGIVRDLRHSFVFSVQESCASDCSPARKAERVNRSRWSHQPLLVPSVPAATQAWHSQGYPRMEIPAQGESTSPHTYSPKHRSLQPKAKNNPPVIKH